MDGSTTLTIRLPAKLKKQLGHLAECAKRTKSFLAAEAIAAYVEHEVEMIEGIKRGMADMKNGRIVPHDKAMNRIHATIDAIERTRS